MSATRALAGRCAVRRSVAARGRRLSTTRPKLRRPLADAGYSQHVVPAALLHDVVPPARRGQRSRSWLKCKQRRHADVLVRFAGRDRRTGRVERAAFTESGVAGSQWASIGTAVVRELLERGTHDPPAAAVLAFECATWEMILRSRVMLAFEDAFGPEWHRLVTPIE